MYYKKASLLNNRARLQRMRDAKFFNGWVKEFDPQNDQISIQVVGSQATFEPGEAFMLEIHGTDRTVVAKAKVSLASEGIVTFLTLGEPMSMPPRERARIKVDGVSASLGANGGSIDVELSDISQEGCGVLSSVQVEKGSVISLSIDSPAGPIDCQGEVRYCKTDPEMEGFYRLGVLLQPLGRLEQARWNKMIEYSLEAA